MNNLEKTKDTNIAPTRVIDYSLASSGPMHVDPRHKKLGFHYCFVSNNPGEIEAKQRIGYDVVIDDELEVGQDKVSTSSRFGSAVTVQSKCGQLLVLMAISDELFDKYEAYKAKVVKSTESAIGQVDGIPVDNLYGKVTKGY